MVATEPIALSAKRSPKFLPGLDLLRAMAALLVMVGHIRNLFFSDYSQVIDRGGLVKAIYFLTGLGHQSVVIFFVLSGLLVGGKVVETIQRGSWSWTRYLIERGCRLCVVLWPALLLTFGWDYLGEQLFGFAHAYRTAHLGDNVIPKDMAAVSTLWVYFANAFFLQGVWAPTAGTNGPLWSLSNEFWYYLAFPALLLSMHPRVPFRHRGKSILVLFLAFLVLYRGGMAGGFLIWLMGVGAARLGRRIPVVRGSSWLSGLAVVLLAGTLAASRYNLVPYADSGIGLATAFLCLWILQSPSHVNTVVSRGANFLSSFSYTLYLTHLPFVIFLRAWLIRIPRWQPDLRHLAFGAAFCLVPMIWAYFVYRATEYYTPQLRLFLLRWLKPNDSTRPFEELSKVA